MHQQGIVHGDIKPANFHLNEDGTFRLGGFGLASLNAEVMAQAELRATGERWPICPLNIQDAPPARSRDKAISTASAWCCMNC